MTMTRQVWVLPGKGCPGTCYAVPLSPVFFPLSFRLCLSLNRGGPISFCGAGRCYNDAMVKIKFLFLLISLDGQSLSTSCEPGRFTRYDQLGGRNLKVSLLEIDTSEVGSTTHTDAGSLPRLYRPVAFRPIDVWSLLIARGISFRKSWICSLLTFRLSRRRRRADERCARGSRRR